MKKIFENFEVFYNMVLSSAIMSNSFSEDFESDSRKIIEFIGKAFEKDDDFIQTATDIIHNKLNTLALTTDQQAIFSNRNFGDVYSDEDSIFDIKGDVLVTLNKIGKTFPQFETWFDYSHYNTYQADIRYYKIKEASSTGELITTRQAGILDALGIGCKVNYTASIRRLSQSAFWGDIPSMYYLAYVYKLSGDEKNARIFYEVAHLASSFLNDGYTVLPDESKKANSEEACNWYAIISSIKRDIVCSLEGRMGFSLIDFSFIEVITLEKLSYSDRMRYTNAYFDKQWKIVTNTPTKNTVGFN